MVGGKIRGAGSAEERGKTLNKKLLEQRVDALAAVSEQLDARADTLNRHLARLDSAQNDLSDTAGSLLERMEELAAKGSELQEELRFSRETAEQAEQRLQNKIAALKPPNGSWDAAIERLGELNTVQQQTASGLEELDGRFQGLNRELTTARDRQSDLQAAFQELITDTGNLQALAADIAATRKDLDTFSRRLQGVEEGVERDSLMQLVEERLGGLESSLQATLSESAAPVQALNDRFAALDGAQDELQGRYGDLSEQLGGLQTSIDTALAADQAGREALQQRLQELEGRLQGMDGQDLNERLDTLEGEREQRESAEKNTAAQLDQLEKTLGELDQESLFERLENLDASAQGIYDSLKEEKERHKTAERSTTAKLAHLKTALGKLDQKPLMQRVDALDELVRDMDVAIRAELDRREATAADNAEQIRQLRQVADHLNGATLIKRMDALDATVHEMDALMHGEREHREGLASDTAAQLERLADTVARLDEADLDQRLVALDAANLELETRLQTERKNREAEHGETQARLQRLAETSGHQEMQQADLSGRLDALDTANQDLEDRLQAEREQREAGIGQTREELEQLVGTSEHRGQQQETLAQRLEDLAATTRELAAAQLADSEHRSEEAARAMEQLGQLQTLTANLQPDTLNERVDALAALTKELEAAQYAQREQHAAVVAHSAQLADQLQELAEPSRQQAVIEQLDTLAEANRQQESKRLAEQEQQAARIQALTARLEDLGSAVASQDPDERQRRLDALETVCRQLETDLREETGQREAAARETAEQLEQLKVLATRQDGEDLQQNLQALGSAQLKTEAALQEERDQRQALVDDIGARVEQLRSTLGDLDPQSLLQHVDNLGAADRELEQALKDEQQQREQLAEHIGARVEELKAAAEGLDQADLIQRLDELDGTARDMAGALEAEREQREAMAEQTLVQLDEIRTLAALLDTEGLSRRLDTLEITTQELAAIQRTEREALSAELALRMEQLKEAGGALAQDALTQQLEALDAGSRGLESDLRAEQEQREALASLLLGEVEELKAAGADKQVLTQRLDNLDELAGELKSSVAAEQQHRAEAASETLARIEQLRDLLDKADQQHLPQRLDDLAADARRLDDALQVERSVRETLAQQAAAEMGQLRALVDQLDQQALTREMEALSSGSREVQEALQAERERREVLASELAAQAEQLKGLLGQAELQELNQRLEALEQTSGLQQADSQAQVQRLGQLEERLDGLDAEGMAQRVQVLTERLDSVYETHGKQDRCLGEVLHGLGLLQQRAETLGEQLTSLDAATQDIDELRERTQRAEEDRSSVDGDIELVRRGLADLETAVRDTTDSIGQEVERIDGLSQMVESDGDQLKSLVAAQTNLREELQEALRRQRELEARLAEDKQSGQQVEQNLQSRFLMLEQTISTLEQAGQAQEERLSGADDELRALRESAGTLLGRVETLGDLPARLEQLEAGREPMASRMQIQEEGFSGLKDRLEHLEQDANSLSDRLTTEAERITVQLDELTVGQARIPELDAEIDQYRVDLSATTSRVEDLAEAAVQIEQGLEQGLAQADTRLDGLEEQDRKQGEVLEQSRERFNYLESTLDNADFKLGALEQKSLQQDQTLDQTRSGQRLLVHTGIATALALAVLSVAGYLFTDEKQDTDRTIVLEKLAQVDRRIIAIDAPEAEKVDALSDDVGDLRTQVRSLSHRYAAVTPQEPAEADPGIRDRLQQMDLQQTNVVQALDHIGERLAQVEEVKREPAKPVAEPRIAPKSTAKPQGTAETGISASAWKAAQKAGQYTVQLLGVRDSAGLNAFARKYGLNGRSAWLKGELNGDPWYVMFYGHYPSKGAANKAARQVVSKAPGVKPWVRQLPKTGSITPLSETTR